MEGLDLAARWTGVEAGRAVAAEWAATGGTTTWVMEAVASEVVNSRTMAVAVAAAAEDTAEAVEAVGTANTASNSNRWAVAVEDIERTPEEGGTEGLAAAEYTIRRQTNNSFIMLLCSLYLLHVFPILN